MKKFFFIFLPVLFISCKQNIDYTNQFQPIDKNAGFESYSFIKNQAYMGGSLIYDSCDVTKGHLQNNVKFLVRLGKVIEIDEHFSDNDLEANYGYIQIKNVDCTNISFVVNLVSLDKSNIVEEYSLNLGDTVDINNDMIPDLRYEIPFTNRINYEQFRYLTFISSMELNNTSMFCVLPSQYKNREYPNGIMGVNSKGNYIVSKYNITNSARTVISDLQYGDYVLDRFSGKYQRCVSNITKGRAVEEEDLNEIQTESILFEESDFISVYQRDEFLNQLIDCGLVDLATIENTITILNKLLNDYQLIEKAYFLNLIENVDDSNMDELFQNIKLLDNETLLYVNRSFLAYLFPDFCYEKSTSSLADIFPLLFCNIGGIDDSESEYEQQRSILTTSFDEYSKERNEINKDYKKYFDLPFGLKKYTVLKKSKEENQSSLIDWNFKIGIQGKIENIWGSKIGMDIAFVIYANIETELDLKKQFLEKSLIGGKKDITRLKIPLNIGVVSLSIEFPLTFDLLFSIKGTYSYPTPLYAGFTGLYGVEAGCGVNYSVTWKKILCVSYPSSLTTASYSTTRHICKTVSYLGLASENPIDLLMPEKTSVNFILTPKFGINANLSALDCLSIGVGGDIGVDCRFELASLNEPVKLMNNNKLPITSSVGVYIVPTVVKGKGEVHLPDIFDILFKIKCQKEFQIDKFNTESLLWKKTLF